MDCWEIAKEDGLSIIQKMDAVNLTGVWPNFPQKPHGHGRYFVAGIYIWMLEQERKKKKGAYEPPEKIRDRLLEEVRKRIVNRTAEDVIMIVAA